MKLRKIIQRRLSASDRDTNVAADINAVVSANVGERGPSHSHVSSRTRIVQRSGRTEVVDETDQTPEGGADEPPREPSTGAD